MWFDAAAGVVRMSWTDSMMPGHWMEASGAFQDDGSLVLEADETDETGQPVRFRMIYRFTAAGAYEFDMGIVLPDGSFAPMMQSKATRTGPAEESWSPPAAAPAPEPAPEANP
jgi:hypothetical protein